jgi:hypothetical protein
VNRKRPGGWVALAWRWYRDPKFDDLSADAERLWCRALAYCGEQETDGRVARSILVVLSPRFAGSVEAAAGELVAAGLWHEVDRGYVVNAWDRWQPTAQQARTSRERDAKRKAVARANADNRADKSRTSGGSPSATGAGEGAGEGLSPTSPDPFPPARERRSQPSGEPTQIRWEEFTDELGRSFVRPAGGEP